MEEAVFLDRCEEACFEAGVIDLTDDEKLQLIEHECEGLTPSQAPRFIADVRERQGR